MLVHELLAEAAHRKPESTALVCGQRRVTYAALQSLSGRYAAAMQLSGVRQGDRVVLVLENSVEAVASIFGALRAGAAFTLLSPAAKPHKLAAVVSDTRPALLLTMQRSSVVNALQLVRPERRPRATLGLTEDRWTRLLAWTDEPRSVGTAPDDLGCIIWTSGTTGRAKGVMSGHDDMRFAARAIATYLDNTGDDVVFSALPLAFSYGLYQLLTAVTVGATLVLEKSFTFPHHALGVMQAERVTGLPAVPTMLNLLLGLSGLERYDLSALRYVTNAAAPLPTAQVTALGRAFPAAAFFSMYGQTECKRVCYLPPDQLTKRPGSVGIPLPETTAFVVDEQGRPLPAGEVGELVVQGPHLMRGYWNLPAETAERLRPWPATGEPTLYTGDLFRTDEEGYLYFVGRVDDMIKSRGEKVAPAEVEEVIRRLPGILDVAAVGVPDPLLGEAIKVFVVTEPSAGLSGEAVRAHCAQWLEAHQVPSLVEFCDSLPHNENGKTLRRKLRACAA